MALVKATLEANINTILNALKTEENQPAAIEKLAVDLATAIDTYIKSATITVPSGIAVATTGSAAAQTGATTAPATATIS